MRVCRYAGRRNGAPLVGGASGFSGAIRARAREEQADGFADEIIDIADSVAPETGEVAKAKLQIDARKWKAAKLAPKKYGEKLELDADMRVKVETRSLEDIFK